MSKSISIADVNGSAMSVFSSTMCQPRRRITLFTDTKFTCSSLIGASSPAAAAAFSGVTSCSAISPQ